MQIYPGKIFKAKGQLCTTKKAFAVMLLGFTNLLYIICLVLLVMVLFFLWRKKRSVPYLICFSLFWIYALVAIDKVLFPIPFDGHFHGPYRLPPWSRINLIPFYFGDTASPWEILKALAYNVLLTLPLGFGIHFIKYVKPQKVLTLSLVVGLGTELLQLVVSILISYSYRVIDVNDVLSNGLGVVLGYLIFRLAGGIYIKSIQPQELNPAGLLSYIYDVALRYQNKPLFGPDETDAANAH